MTESLNYESYRTICPLPFECLAQGRKEQSVLLYGRISYQTTQGGTVLAIPETCLRISLNQLEGLKNLENLSELSIESVSAGDLTLLRHLKKLKVLKLKFVNGLTPVDFTPLAELTELEILVLEWVSKAKNLECLRTLKKLRTLELEHVWLENRSKNYTFIGELQNLQNLKLSIMRIEDVSFLSDLKNLRNLNLSMNEIKDISVLKQLEDLREIDLSTNRIRSIEPLKHLYKLKKVNLDWNCITSYELFENVNQAWMMSFFHRRMGEVKALRLPQRSIKNFRNEEAGGKGSWAGMLDKYFLKHTVSWDCVWFGSYPQYKSELFRRNVETGIWKEHQDYIIDENGDYLYEDDQHRKYKFRKLGNDYFIYDLIRWRVLDVSGSSVILLADNILDMVLFDTEKQSVKAAYADVLEWLNGQDRNDFYQNAFSEQEKETLRESEKLMPYLEVIDEPRKAYSEQKEILEAVWNENKVNLMSYLELTDKQYAHYGFNFDGKTTGNGFYLAEVSDYVKAKSGNVDLDYEKWLIGASFSKEKKAIAVSENGKFIKIGKNQQVLVGIRPKICVDLSVFQSMIGKFIPYKENYVKVES